MKKTILLIIVLLLFISISPAFAEIKTFIREHSYHASEYESKDDCRTLALAQLGRILLEELGTFLESETEIKNFQLTKDRITAYTAGIVRTYVLDENWNGKRYWLRAKIDADPDDVIKQVADLREDRQKTKQLESLKRQVDENLKENEKMRKELATAKGEMYKKRKIAYDNNIRKVSANESFLKGIRFSWSGNNKEAIDAFSKAIELNPQDASLYSYRAMTYKWTDNHEQAINDYTKAIELNPEEADYYKSRGFVFERLGKHNEAINDYTSAIELKPEEVDSYKSRGYLFGTLGKHREAITDYDKIIQLGTREARVYCSRAGEYGELGNFKQAIKDIRRAIQIDPRHTSCSPYYLSFGLNKNNYLQVIADCDRDIKINPKDADAYVIRGLAYRDALKYEKAIEDISTAIKLNPKNAFAYFLRGHIYSYLKTYQNAYESYMRQYHPGYVHKSSFSFGSYEKAIKDFSKVIQLNPEYAVAYYERGRVYSSLGYNKEAIDDFKQSAKKGYSEAQTFLKSKGIEW
ncbi:MAG: tetratricopeptide repeat protein [Syntrophales bacterium]